MTGPSAKISQSTLNGGFQVMKWENIFGIGIAGNFTGHLEQAGEANDFLHVRVADKQAPKGVFPFYVPNYKGNFLEISPISSTTIRLKNDIEDHQVEPEMAILCEAQYENGILIQLQPQYAMAFNDCSIRKPNVPKISLKKNWGLSSKGISENMIPIDTFESNGILDNYHITSYLKRNDQIHQYGLDSPVAGYKYFYSKLMNWLVEQIQSQKDTGPLESISEMLNIANHPSHIIVSVGATKYTPFGEKTYLKHGDVIYVILYDATVYDETGIQHIIQKDIVQELYSISILRQQVLGNTQTR